MALCILDCCTAAPTPPIPGFIRDAIDSIIGRELVGYDYDSYHTREPDEHTVKVTICHNVLVEFSDSSKLKLEVKVTNKRVSVQAILTVVSEKDPFYTKAHNIHQRFDSIEAEVDLSGDFKESIRKNSKDFK